MKVYELWKKMSDTGLNDTQRAMFWKEYFDVETEVYKQILAEKPEKIEGEQQEIAKRYDLEPAVFAGFLDGINESLKESVDLESLEEATPLSLEIDYPMLYKNMLAAKAKWLSGLKEWDDILTKEERLEIKKAYAEEHMVRNENKIGRNDPCPCGSGKKYKKCCLNKAD